MTTASASREVPFPRATVWQALAVLQPYCAVCDVSYVVTGSPTGGTGTTFVCVPGRLEGRAPAEGALRGEIVEWVPRQAVATRLDLTPETWTTRIQLADANGGGTRVTITLSHEAKGGSRLVQGIQRRALQRMVRSTVEDELDKLPAHVAQVAAG
ncbi:SRPBCC family protein [Geodermatophilus sp. SYSU D00691]